MFKKLLSLAIVVMIVLSVAAVAASAAQVQVGDQGAEAIAEVGAEASAEVGADSAASVGADSGASTAAGNTISFDANSTGWNNFKTIYAHIWAVDGTGDWPGWQSKKEKCTDADKDGVYEYDLSKTGNTIESGAKYAVVFSADTGMQTYDLLFGAECIGDTAYCDPSTTYENPKDSHKTAPAAFWKNADKTKFGPQLAVTSIGNIVGTCVAGNQSKYSIFVDFLKNTLENARTFSGKDDQALLDDTAKALDLMKDDVTNAIAEAGVTVTWEASKSSLSDGSNPEADTTGTGEKKERSSGTKKSSGGSGSDTDSASDTDGDSNSSSSGTTTTGSSSSGSGSSSSGSGSSSVSGSGASSTTGQSTTMLFIMLGVMVAAAGVIIFVRKKDRA